MADEINASEDQLDVRDIIARIEELETDQETAKEEGEDALNEFNGIHGVELKELSDLMEELKGNDGDEQWRGDWYPISLIHEDYFVRAMKELVEDIGDVSKNLPEYIAINWEKTAENLRADYSSVEFGGNTFWYR